MDPIQLHGEKQTTEDARRTDRYFAAARVRAGFLESTGDDFDSATVDHLESWGWIEPLAYLSYDLIAKDGRYGLRTGGACMDDAWEETLWLEFRPTEEDARAFVATIAVEGEITRLRNAAPYGGLTNLDGWNDRAVCRACGSEMHWLDLPGSVMEKLARVADRRCGCAASRRPNEREDYGDLPEMIERRKWRRLTILRTSRLTIADGYCGLSVAEDERTTLRYPEMRLHSVDYVIPSEEQVAPAIVRILGLPLTQMNWSRAFEAFAKTPVEYSVPFRYTREDGASVSGTAATTAKRLLAGIGAATAKPILVLSEHDAIVPTLAMEEWVVVYAGLRRVNRERAVDGKPAVEVLGQEECLPGMVV